ncbi:MAG TPA: YdcF family protein [Cyanophyceae cyanobacterium]
MKTLKPNLIEQIRKLTNNQDRFDAIIAFGYGPVRTGNRPNSYKLNVYGKVNAIATGILYQNLTIKKIIPTGGKTGGWYKPSEAELMARLIQSKFHTPKSAFMLEEESMDTIFNLVYVANIIDQFSQGYDNLIFVALGFHLPRIKEICSRVGLDGTFIAAEDVVKLRSERHERFLDQLLSPNSSTYGEIIAVQERGMRGVREIPEYWLPPMAELTNLDRIRRILELQSTQLFIDNYPINMQGKSVEYFRAKLRLIPRQFP